MLPELRARARAAIGEGVMLKIDRGDALFLTTSPICPRGFRQQARGTLYALSPITPYPPETEAIWIALIKQTDRKDSRFPSLIRAARGRMAVCLRTGENDCGLDALEALIRQIEEESV